VADIFGTAANDVLAGTTAADRIEGGAGNDRINGGAGDDEILGGVGADILTGDAGNDRIYGEDGNDGVYGGGGDDFVDGGVGDDILFGDGGNDTLIGGVGNDRISGGIGNDTIDGGAGNDTLNGEAGDDTFVWRTGDGQDTIIGGGGADRIELVLSAADITASVRADFEAYQAWAAQQAAAAGSVANLAAQTTGASFTFASLGLTISVIETVAVKVDGRAVAVADLINSAPVANAAAQIAGVEDQVLSGAIAATDADGDALSFVVETGPVKGTVALDSATGRFIYTPAADISGNDSFVVRITDSRGASVAQTVNVAIAAVADAPTVVAADATAVLAQPVVGTEASDVIVGNAIPATATLGLVIGAGLADIDGSEGLAIHIAGIPDAGALSAGVKQADGTWLLTAADLVDLKLTAPTGADFLLTATATATDANGSASSSSTEFHVTFDHTGLGDDVIDGAGGDDIIEAGHGNDRVSGGKGDDTFIQHAGDGTDVVSGGDGHDVLELVLSSADVTPQFLAELSDFQGWMAKGADGVFGFNTLGLTVDTIEYLVVSVDGLPVSIAELLNVAPTAEAVTKSATFEDTAVKGQVTAVDANGDVLTYMVEKGPANGTVTLDPNTGAFVYTPGHDISGNDSFVVRVSDPFGASVVQKVEVAVAAQADAPTLSAVKADVDVARISTLTGTRGNDVIRGDQHVATATVALVIAAALMDTDGSESLSVRISGVPDGATLSAGARQSDGAWLLGQKDLNGLMLTAPTAKDLTLTVTAIANDGTSVAQSSTALDVAFHHSSNLNDTIIASVGTDTYDGANGIDTVDYSSAATAANINLESGKASGPGTHTLVAIENAVGTAQDDNITGNAAANILEGGAGNDRVNGGAGNDVLVDGAGNDRYDGGSGYDVLDYSKATRGVTVDTDDGDATGMGNDTFSNVEKIVGSNFNDSFFGDKGVDTFDGGAGNDMFRGYEGSDVFAGGAGRDTFVWQEKDVVSGKKSQGVDSITDFGAGDKLDLSDITDSLFGNLLGSDPSTVIKVTDGAVGSMVAVKVGNTFYDVVVLQNVHGVTAASLIADGQLIA